MTPRTWHLITGEYPPMPGGVADYTALVGAGLADAGCEVHVWTRGDADHAERPQPGLTVWRVAGHFGPRGLARLSANLNAFPRPRTILVQYVPHAYGYRAANLPFCLAMLARALRRDDVRAMYHELFLPWRGRSWKHTAAAAVQRAMVAALAMAAPRAYVSTPLWEPLLRAYAIRSPRVAWLPVPSNIPLATTASAVAAFRSGTGLTVGHFGTYGDHIAPLLAPILERILAARPSVRALLVGANGDRFRTAFVRAHPAWEARVTATGRCSAEATAAALRACDVMVQPYSEGLTARRGTLMAVLAHGVAAVSTDGTANGCPPEAPFRVGNPMALAAPGDSEGMAAMALALLDDPHRRAAAAEAGRRLYDDHFALDRTIRKLLAPG